MAPGRRHTPHVHRHLGQSAARKPPGIAGILQPERAAGAVARKQQLLGRHLHVQPGDDAGVADRAMAGQDHLRRRTVRKIRPGGRDQAQPDENRAKTRGRATGRRRAFHGQPDRPVAARHPCGRRQGGAPGTVVANCHTLQGLRGLFVRRRLEILWHRGAGNRHRHHRRPRVTGTFDRRALLAGGVEPRYAERQIHGKGLRKERRLQRRPAGCDHIAL